MSMYITGQRVSREAAAHASCTALKTGGWHNAVKVIMRTCASACPSFKRSAGGTTCQRLLA